MISYICLLATVFANLSCADDMDNSKFDNMIPYGKQEVSYTYPKGEGSLRVLTFNIRHCAGNDDVINYDRTAKFDLANRFDRIVRLTVNSSHMADAMLSAKGDKLYYLSVFEDGYDLWEHNLKENVTKVLLKKVGAGALQPDKEGKNIFLCARDGMKKIEIEGRDSFMTFKELSET